MFVYCGACGCRVSRASPPHFRRRGGGREGEEGSGLREGISSGHLRNCVGEKPAKAAGYFPSRETRGQVALSRDLRRKRRQNKDMSGRPSWYFEMFLVE